MKKILGAILALVLTAAPAARADNWSLNAGVGQFSGIPLSNAGTYLYAGPGFTKSFPGCTWTTVLALEYSPSPENWRGGVFGWSTVDVQLAETWYLNLGVSAMHDQPKLEFGQSQFYTGPTLGVTKNLSENLFISPSAMWFFSLTDGSSWLYPMVTVGNSF